MSHSVHINWDLLTALVKLKIQPRVSLLRIADKSLVTAICECALNILNRNIPISAAVKSELSKEKSVVRYLGRNKTHWKSKRLVIVKKAKRLIPLIIDTALKHIQNEPREKDGSYLTGGTSTVEHTRPDQ